MNETIAETLPSGLLVIYHVWRDQSSWKARTAWRGTAHVSGRMRGMDFDIIGVTFGMSGWTSCGAQLPYRAWSRDKLLDRMRRDVAESGYGKER